MYFSANLSYKIIFVGTSIECTLYKLVLVKLNYVSFIVLLVAMWRILYNNLSSFYPILLNNFILIGGSPTALRNYKYTRNKVTAELRKAKRAFLNKLNDADSKSFWKVYKIISKQETNIPCLESPTTGSMTDSHQKANLLNSQFFKNFNHNNIPPYESTLLPIDPSNFPDELLCLDEEIELHLRVLEIIRS